MPLAHLISNRNASAPAMLCGIALLAATTALTGCGMSTSGTTAATTTAAPATAKFSGSIFGGQQPIVGATVQLYTVGTTGIASASSTLGTAAVTDANGSFSLTGKYTCTSATQVYLLASGGNAGAGTNSAIEEAAALGSCTTLLANAATTFLNVNELTTVAAAYAFAPFASDGLHIGATGANPTGLVNTMLNAQALVNIPTGTVGGASLPAGASVNTAEIDTLGNIAAACINGAGPSTVACTNLFTTTGASNTFDALFAIAKNPSSAAYTALYSSTSATSPFQPALSSQPKDFSIAITYNPAGSLALPFAIAIDAAGNAWIANAAGTGVTELSPTGSVATTATVTGLFGPQGVAIDRTGNLWVSNTIGNSLIKFTLSAGAITSNASYITGGLSAPTALAIDSGNNVFAANFNGNSVTGLTSSGAALTGSPFTATGAISLPSGIAIGTDGSLYITSGSGSIVKLASSTQPTPGSYLSTLTHNTHQGPFALALDTTNDVLLTGYTSGTAITGAVSEFSATGTATLTTPLTGGIAAPSGVAFDGSFFWIANGGASGSLAKLTYGNTSVSSPTAGYGSLNQPQGIAIDSTGSIWAANSGNNTVTRYIGIATPVATPVSLNVGP